MRSYRVSCFGLIVAATVFSAIGCDSSTSDPGPSMETLANRIEQHKQAEAAAKAAEEARVQRERDAAAKAAADEEAARLAAEQAAAEAAAAPTPPPAEPSKTTAGAATVGGGGGYYSAIVAAHRHITTRVDDLAWTQALQHYKAETGEMPKNNEEFMKIMAEKEIPLPELEQGQELLWDPSEGDWGTLYITEPKPQ